MGMLNKCSLYFHFPFLFLSCSAHSVPIQWTCSGRAKTQSRSSCALRKRRPCSRATIYLWPYRSPLIRTSIFKYGAAAWKNSLQSLHTLIDVSHKNTFPLPCVYSNHSMSSCLSAWQAKNCPGLSPSQWWSWQHPRSLANFIASSIFGLINGCPRFFHPLKESLRGEYIAPTHFFILIPPNITGSKRAASGPSVSSFNALVLYRSVFCFSSSTI